MSFFGSLATVRSQAPQTRGFETAFAYLEEVMRTGSTGRRRLEGMAPGESRQVELGAGVFAIEQVYESKPRAEGFFESHRKYIDVQAVVEGVELMEATDVARLSIRTPYVPERDVIIYDDASGPSVLYIRAGDAAVFYPADAHMPSLRPGDSPGLVRKSVVKVPVG